MAILRDGTPLGWKETQALSDYIREHGIVQFLHLWNCHKDRRGDKFLWGDEIEYIMISYDNENRNALLALRQSEVLDAINGASGTQSLTAKIFQPEYARFMIESTPESPYDSTVASLLSVETNMQNRRELAKSYMRPNEVAVTLASYPRLGVADKFTEPAVDPSYAPHSHSMFLAEEITAPHLRFHAGTRHLRQRAGSKPTANVPIYFDTNTPRPFHDPTIPWDRVVYPEDSEARQGAAKSDHIYLDAAGFGSGCCCLQVTFQASDIDDARRMYDAFIPMTPILMALTACAPAYRGYLSDVDCRWNVIVASSDDRTDEEKGLKPLKDSKFVVPKSRYSSVDTYISPDVEDASKYNDISAPLDESLYNRLRQNGVDDLLSKHFAQIFLRDPLTAYSTATRISDGDSTEHFDNIQGSVWQSLRFKPPPSADSKIGWRVEVRTMEVQPTDFENAAFAVFVVLLARAIKASGLEGAFRVPISKVDENMERAEQRNAVLNRKFWFRTNAGSKGPDSQECEEMTLDEIVNGKGDASPGLLGIIALYIDSLAETVEEKAKLKRYLDLIAMRANGTVQTPATWIRNFVRSHPAYKFDSVVSREINYDLIKTLEKIAFGQRSAGFLSSHNNSTSIIGELL